MKTLKKAQITITRKEKGGITLYPANFFLKESIGNSFKPIDLKIKVKWIIIQKKIISQKRFKKKIENINSYITIKDTESVLENLSTKKF